MCVKWCCFFCFLLCEVRVWVNVVGYAVRELLRARIYAHAFPEFFIFCCHKCHRGVCKTSFYSISFMPHRLESAEKSIVCADEMMKFCVVNWCFYISLSKNVSNRVVFRWNIMWYLCSVTLVTAKKTKSLYCVRTRAREGRVLRSADWSIRKDLLSKELQIHFSINNNALRLFFFNRRVVLWKVTCRFEESDVSFLGKQRVVFLQPTCRFVRKNSKCDFAGCYYGLITALYFQNQCVKRLSVFLGSNYVHFQNRSAKKEWIVTLRFLKYKLTLRWNLLLHLRCP